ncbi:hypothetical protein ACJBU6_10871 [Exserohilum turcicum]
MTGAVLAAEHTVSVSDKDGNIIFKPDTIEAAQGDMISFHFWPKNHSVVQATFDKPCQPMDGGFYSGFVPTSDASAAASTVFMYEVKNASAPIWFYCSQGKHCQGGMVGVINQAKTGDKTIDAFKKAAQTATDNVSPASKAGTGGNLTQSSGTKASPSASMASGTGAQLPKSTGAASQLAGSAFVAGLAGAFTFFML